MDPVTALGVASSAASFVQFAASLLSGTWKIYRSHSDISEDGQTLDTIYGSLQRLSSKMSQQHVLDEHGSDDSDAAELRELALVCQRDCEKLLRLVEALAAQDKSRPRLWASFSKAMSEIWKSKEILELKSRIASSQVGMVTQMCAASRLAGNTYKELLRLEHENERMRIRCNSRLDELKQSVQMTLDCLFEMKKEKSRLKFSKTEMEFLTTELLEISKESGGLAREQALVASLDYYHRPLRHNTIPKAHRKTFEWIFRTRGDGSFADWLEKGSGLFWISGKPGAGKSTLMKFLAAHSSTQRLLRTWSGAREVVIASHYFWSAGSSIQRSQEGLLRSLLFDIFSQAPALVPTSCQTKWQVADGSQHSARRPPTWTMEELRETLARIATFSGLPFNFCFLVDGLDEFEGDCTEVCDTLLRLCRSPHIKMCVASRPWNVFQDAFRRDSVPRVLVQDLTRQDIRCYVRDRLQSHPRWDELATYSAQASKLVDDTAGRAQGVFLWVFLVTRELRSGLTNDDSLADLNKRLRSFPTELESFFKHMLGSVEPFYYDKMARTILMATVSEEPLPLEVYAFHELGYEDPHYAVNIPVQEITKSKWDAITRPVSRRINGRTKGLLEVNGKNVEFLHRTVRDFLRTQEMSAFLRQNMPPDYCSQLSCTRAFTAWLKHCPQPWSLSGRAVETWNKGAILNTIFFHAGGCDGHGEACYRGIEVLIDCLEDAANEIGLECSCPNYFLVPKHSHNISVAAIRSKVIEWCQSRYLGTKLESDPTYLSFFKMAPLFLALPFTPRSHLAKKTMFEQYTSHRRPHASGQETQPGDILEHPRWSPYNTSRWDSRLLMLRLLLEQDGVSPNDEFLEYTPWTWLMNNVILEFFPDSKEETDKMWDRLIDFLKTGIIELFLHHGADPTASNVGRPGSDCEVWVDFFVMSFELPNVCAEPYLQVHRKMLSKVPPDACLDAVADTSSTFWKLVGVHCVGQRQTSSLNTLLPSWQQELLSSTLITLFERAGCSERLDNASLRAYIADMLKGSMSPQILSTVLDAVSAGKPHEYGVKGIRASRADVQNDLEADAPATVTNASTCIAM